MKSYAAVIERDPVTGLFVGFVPGFPGAHSQGRTLDELDRNLQEVIAMLLEDVPFHQGRDIYPVLLRQIAKDIGLTVGKFVKHQ